MSTNAVVTGGDIAGQIWSSDKAYLESCLIWLENRVLERDMAGRSPRQYYEDKRYEAALAIRLEAEKRDKEAKDELNKIKTYLLQKYMLDGLEERMFLLEFLKSKNSNPKIDFELSSDLHIPAILIIYNGENEYWNDRRLCLESSFHYTNMVREQEFQFMYDIQIAPHNWKEVTGKLSCENILL